MNESADYLLLRRLLSVIQSRSHENHHLMSFFNWIMRVRCPLLLDPPILSVGQKRAFSVHFQRMCTFEQASRHLAISVTDGVYSKVVRHICLPAPFGNLASPARPRNLLSCATATKLPSTWTRLEVTAHSSYRPSTKADKTYRYQQLALTSSSFPLLSGFWLSHFL